MILHQAIISGEKMKKQKIHLIISLILSIFVVSACGTGNVVYDPNCPQYGCKLTTTEAKFESKVKDDSGSGCLTDCNADVWVKNIENQPAFAQIIADCHTVSKSTQYSSEMYWMQPQEEHTFQIKVDAGSLEDWKCENFKIKSGQITGCEAYQI